MSDYKKNKGKALPGFKTDKDAENWLEEADLSEYDLSEFRPIDQFFEFKPKDKSVHLRLPESLLTAVKQRAKLEGLPYQRYMRKALEQSLWHGDQN